ncbi:MAG: hypothetical protein IPG80_04560 [Anaerolineales bacterium]|uniref:hypothetical protein n=1 Tax=Candidatus Villigracilis vicinus TaxID=3140679 RepID=UPI003134F5F6|nr:hypothetical protein [Anaerolineales bacterium]
MAALGRIASSRFRRDFPRGWAYLKSACAPHFGPARIAILETPAGFEFNASSLPGAWVSFSRPVYRTTNPYRPGPRPQKGTEFSPDNPDILKPLLQANIIFMGPGSPVMLPAN